MHDFLAHEGVSKLDGAPVGSGRYPLGSGENPYQGKHWFGWYSSINDVTAKLAKEGIPISEKEIATALGISTGELRARKSIIKEGKMRVDIDRVRQLKQHQYSNQMISEMTGLSIGTVNNYLKEDYAAKESVRSQVADNIRRNISKDSYIDVGKGTELYLNCSEVTKKNAIKQLESEGYVKAFVNVEQQNNPGKFTSVEIMCPPGTDWKTQINTPEGRAKIKLIDEAQIEMPDGVTKQNMYYPKSIDRNRVYVRYNEEGGLEKDGTIELRRGVEDIALGQSQYAQVRIAVDNKYYMKGMAYYSDDIPKGYDVVYNVNKHIGSDDDAVFKKLKADMDNPFGSNLKEGIGDIGGQRLYIDKNGKEQLSVINKLKEEGDWGESKKRIASQVLGKQPVSVAKGQLDITIKQKQAELAEINALTNNTVKKKLLIEFADQCDADAVHLKAAAFPRQATQVILPSTTLKDNEIYAPNYRHGETVVLIRYPHGGKFEIPELVVNNKNVECQNMLGKANRVDAVCINANVAGQLSGADFDGDTVAVIPNNQHKLKWEKQLKKLENFDPKEVYGGYDKAEKKWKLMSEQYKQRQMGEVSNLITDMILQNAEPDEVARAVKHSMVVIDAVKHKLDYQRSDKENNIKELKQKYQPEGGASTLLSRAKSQTRIDERDPNFRAYDPQTGKVIYRETGRTYKDRKTGEQVKALQTSTKMFETDDARTLMSGANHTGTAMERAYADYANTLKKMGNQARKEYMSLEDIHRSPSAAKAYSKEVESLDAKLNIAQRNAPLMRKAQVMAELIVNQKIEADPSLKSSDKKADLKKIRKQALDYTKGRMGASRTEKLVTPTEREWEAIEAGAISATKLNAILQYSDADKIRQYATPKSAPLMSSSKVALAKSMKASGWTLSEIADHLGVSTSTISKALSS